MQLVTISVQFELRNVDFIVAKKVVKKGLVFLEPNNAGTFLYVLKSQRLLYVQEVLTHFILSGTIENGSTHLGHAVDEINEGIEISLNLIFNFLLIKLF